MMGLEMKFKRELDFVDDKEIVNSCRRGIKWALPIHPPHVRMYTPLNEYQGRIISVKVKRFCDITTEDIKYNFEKDCRLQSRLLERMKEIYDNFDETEIVTLIDVEVLY